MKKTITLSALFLMISLFSPTLKAQFAGGTGTQGDPFQITTAQELYDVNLHNGAENVYFSLENDIDLTDFLETNFPENGWPGIGRYRSEFKGYFNGNNHKISGMWIIAKENDNALFRGSYGHIENCILENVRIEGDPSKNTVGGFIANMPGGSITNCHVRGITISSVKEQCGGFAGNVGKEAVITDCSASDVNIIDCGSNSGGFVGRFREETGKAAITNCTVTGSFTSSIANATCGGFVGFNNAGNITNCHAVVTVNTAGKYVGGFVGANEGLGQIENCSFTGTVKGVEVVGGFAGQGRRPIINCHAAAEVTGGTTAVGGFIGISNDQGKNDTKITSSSFQGKIIAAGPGSLAGGFVGKHHAGNADAFSDCYAHAVIYAQEGRFVGGFAGTTVEGAPDIKNVYFAGAIHTSNAPAAGAFAGSNEGYVVFENTFASAIPGLNASGDNYTDGITLLEKDEMKQTASYPAGWFADVWTNIDNVTYPYFKTQSAPAAISSLSATQLVLALNSTPEAVSILKNYQPVEAALNIDGTVCTAVFTSALEDKDVVTVMVREAGKTASYAVSKEYDKSGSTTNVIDAASAISFTFDLYAGEISITGNSPIQSVQILSADGKIVCTEKFGYEHVRISTGSLNGGIYLVKVSTLEKDFVYKIMKPRLAL